MIRMGNLSVIGGFFAVNGVAEITRIGPRKFYFQKFDQMWRWAVNE